MGLKLHQVKSAFRDNSHLLKSRSEVSSLKSLLEKLAICNTFRDNSHLLFLSR